MKKKKFIWLIYFFYLFVGEYIGKKNFFNKKKHIKLFERGDTEDMKIRAMIKIFISVVSRVIRLV